MRKIILMFLFFLISIVSKSDVYITVRDGDLNSNIWKKPFSLNLRPQDTIYINNLITYDNFLEMNAVMIISDQGKLDNSHNTLLINATGKVIVNGNLKIKGIVNKGTLINNGKIEVSVIPEEWKSICMSARLIIQPSFNLRHNFDNSFCVGCLMEETTNRKTAEKTGKYNSWMTDAIKLQADYEKAIVKLNWEAITEDEGVSHFEVEKSYDANDFTQEEIVANIKSANGKFQWEGKVNDTQITYYRLKIVNRNGQCHYSKPVSIALKKD